jgi:hypothetical protein
MRAFQRDHLPCRFVTTVAAIALSSVMRMDALLAFFEKGVSEDEEHRPEKKLANRTIIIVD